MINGDPVQLQEEFRNSMAFIVQRVADDPDPDPELVLRHLVEKLGEFLAASEGRIAASWRGGGARFGAACVDAEPPATLRRDELAANERHTLVPPAYRLPYHPIELSWWGKPYHTIRIAPAEAPGDHILELGFESRDVDAGVRWEWLMQYVRGLGELHHTVRGLVVARIGRAKEALKSEIQGFQLSRAVPVHVNLAEALRVLPRLLDLGVLELVEELLESLLLHMFGLGRRIRTVRRESEARPGEQHPTRMTRALIDQIHGYARSFPQAPSGRLMKLVSCLEAVIAPEAAGVSDHGDPELALLSRWTRIHELARDVRTSRLIDDAEAAWHGALDTTQRALVQILQRSVEQHRVDSTRNWMTIWFCRELLREVPAGANPWDFRSELAYVLRELLRERLFGDRKDYFYDQDAFVDSLASLVFHHATRAVDIPPSYVANLLELIRREGGENRYSVTDHLQHVADIYIAGHLFLSLHIRRAGHSQRAVELLAGYAQDDVIQQHRGAFSLAAMFHDVGHVFLPTDPHVVLADVSEDTVVRVLQDRAATSRELAEQITERCIEELALDGEPRAHGRIYLEPPPVRDAVVRQFRRQAADGRASHALLSAWYLHRVCERVAEMRRETPEARSYAAIAVRAILLHDLHTVELDAGRDPIAALLVLCNEVFEWAPSRRQSDAARLRDRDGAGPRLERATELLHLRLEADELVLDAPDGSWPELAVELMPHEYVDRPILAIWLSKAQAIGRIKPGEPSGFAPTVRIRSYRDPDLAHCNLQTWQALRQALGDRHFPELVEWCDDPQRFRVFDKHGAPGAPGAEAIQMEEVRLRYLHEQLCHRGLAAVIPEITRLVDELVKRQM